MDTTITEQELAEFVRRAEEPRARTSRDVDRYLDLLHHAHGFTLPPVGGPTSRHEERAAELMSWRNFLTETAKPWST